MEAPLEQQSLIGESAGDIIRRVFVELGSNVPSGAVTRSILDRDLLPSEMRDGFLFRGLNDRVRKELARITIEGLPFAQPTGTKQRAPWKQLDLFTREEAYSLVRRRRRNLYEDHAELVRLHGWCLDKFGDAPDIPDLPPLVEDGPVEQDDEDGDEEDR
jgi:hypothetical protein